MSTIDFKSFLNLAPGIVRARYPMLLRGPHGIGKSSLVYQLAERVGEYLDIKDASGNFKKFEVVERRASQMPDAGDIMGLPFQEGEATAFKPMKWFHKACQEPVILFFDELDRGAMDVRQALFELADSRKIAGQTLHPDTLVIAAVNSGPQDNNTYQVGEFDVAELDRWVVFDIKPSLEDFYEYAKSGTFRKDAVGRKIGPFETATYDFLREYDKHVEFRGEFEPNKVYPSRRSWDRMDDTLQKGKFLDSVLNVDVSERQMSAESILPLVQGHVGIEAAIDYVTFLRNYAKKLTLEDVLVRGEVERCKNLDNSMYLALIDKLEHSPYVNMDLSAEKGICENLCKFILCVPHEMVMKIWEVVTSKNALNGVALHQTVVVFDGKKTSVGAYLAEVNGSGKETI